MIEKHHEILIQPMSDAHRSMISGGRAFVSIIMPVFDRGYLIPGAFENVCQQIYRPIELIVVDDGSKESMLEIVKKEAQACDFQIRYIRQENRGPGMARQTGLDAAQGQLIQYLDSDDRISPTKLEKQVSLLLVNPEASLCYCRCEWIDLETGKNLGIYAQSNTCVDRILPAVLQGRYWQTSAPLWNYHGDKKEVWTHYYHGEDWLHSVFQGIRNRPVVYVPESLVQIGVLSSGRVSQIESSDQWKRYYLFYFEQLEKICKVFGEKGLLRNSEIAEPLAERYFANGLSLLAARCDQEAFSSLGTAKNLSCFKKVAFEVFITKCFYAIFKKFGRSGASVASRLHHLLWPSSRHWNRGL